MRYSPISRNLLRGKTNASINFDNKWECRKLPLENYISMNKECIPGLAMNNGSMKLFRREYSYSLIAEIQGLFECETYCSIYTLKFVLELQKVCQE